MRLFTTLIASFLCVLTAAADLAAQQETEPAELPADSQIQGPSAVLEAVDRELKRLKTDAQAQDADDAEPQDKLQTHIDAYLEQAEDAPADQTVDQWLQLLDKALQMPEEPERHEGRERHADPSMQDRPLERIVAVMPGPPTWATLAEALEARTPAEADDAVIEDESLDLFGHLLVRDVQAMAEDVAALLDAAEQMSRSERDRLYEALMPLQLFLGHVQDDPQIILEDLEHRIAVVERTPERHYAFDVPDLVTLFGRDKAEQLLGRIVVLPVERIEIETGAKTRELARQVTIEKIDELKAPRWRLVDDIRSVELFEALADRFLPEFDIDAQDQEAGAAADDADADPDAPKPDGKGIIGQVLRRLVGAGEQPHEDPFNSWELRQAGGYYVLGLIAQGRTEDATRALKQFTRLSGDEAEFDIPYNALQGLDRAGFTDEVAEFLHARLSENPNLPLWDAYQDVAVRSGQADRMLDLAKQAREREGLSSERRLAVLKQLADAQFAADHVEQGVATLQRVMEAFRKEDAANEFMDAAMDLARIGHVLENEQWQEQGVRAARDKFDELAESGDVDQISYEVRNLAALLIELGRFAQAEQVLSEMLTHSLVGDPDQHVYYTGSYGSSEAQRVLVQLAQLYQEANRPQDVLNLLENAPYWGADDLAEIYKLSSSRYGRDSETLGYITAWALHEQDRSDEALPIVRAVLEHEPGDDDLYAMLIDIQGVDALPVLDWMFERDQFEERPLIWKAKVLLEQDRVEEAEQAIRKAISIDPSDGEQGRGDRMRAYAVLADVEAALGNAEQQEFFQQVVKAIRMAEQADRYYGAGLLLRGVELYREALTQFADAYCIQSRLAIQLSRLGRHDEAAEHFRRAYELMPDSFGRVESHCFGCEGVFYVGYAQSIAEQVFNRLLQETPDKPQVHYLMGYLRQTQDQYREAADHYLDAIELDEDYLNAWSRLRGLSRHVHLPIEVRDRANLNMLRLDPLQRHTSPQLGEVLDLPGLWVEVERAASLYVEPPEQLLALPAAAKYEAPQQEQMPEWMQINRRYMSRDDDDRLRSPGHVLANHIVVQAVTGLLTDE